jgi:hypothetical protein
MPFPKGHKLSVGNKGPTKRLSLTQQLISQLLEVTDAKKPNINRVAKLVSKLIALGEQGNLDAIKFIFDRIDGKLKERVELSGDPNNPMQNTHTIRVVVSETREDFERIAAVRREMLSPPDESGEI